MCSSRRHWGHPLPLHLSACSQRSGQSTHGGDRKHARIPWQTYKQELVSSSDVCCVCVGFRTRLSGERCLTRAFMCFLMKSSLEEAQRGSTTSVTGSWDNCKRPRSKPTTSMRQTFHYYYYFFYTFYGALLIFSYLIKEVLHYSQHIIKINILLNSHPLCPVTHQNHLLPTAASTQTSIRHHKCSFTSQNCFLWLLSVFFSITK